MKKLILLFFAFILGLSAFASDEEAVKQFFNSYVEAGNTYKSNYFDYYITNPKIERVVIKKDGTTKSVTIPLSEFKKHSKLNVKVGKLRHYKNYYTNIKIVPQGEDYKLSAMRKPSTSSYSLPVHYLIGKDSNGQLKIKEESIQTKVQSFLKKK